jgi:hypothetical protein
MRGRLLAWLVIGTVFASGTVAACGGSEPPALEDPQPGGEDLEAGIGDGSGGPSFDLGVDPDGWSDVSEDLEVQPSGLQTITVPLGAATPTVTFTATYAGAAINAAWDVDRGDVATIAPGPSATGVLTPTGRTGGLVTVTVAAAGKTLQRQVFVKISGEQDGATGAQAGQIANDVPSLTAGGGIGGVGGQGLGVAVADAGTKTALDAPTGDGSAQRLTLLYPYDATVFPRGLLAPLLMWRWTEGDADAIKIELATTSGSFAWKGTFGRPAILATTGGKFVRHPIPQDVWRAATETAGGRAPDGSLDRLQVKLTVAKGGVAYGPLTSTWTIAPGRLSGTVYYNSYGTRLAKNYGGAVGGDRRFGGATLGIKIGDTAPKLVAGGDGDDNQCRVCHSVAANGSRLVTALIDGRGSSTYELSPTGATETRMGVYTDFPAISPDGSVAITAAGNVLVLPAAPTNVATVGRPATDLGTPAFSPDGKLVAFNPMGGGTITNPRQKLFVAPFDIPTRTFGAPVLVADSTGQPAASRPGWAAFLPDSTSLVFQQQIAAGADGNTAGALWTRKGAKAYLAWTNAGDATKVTPLDRLNGKGYLPKLDAPYALACTADGVSVGGIDADHGDDANLNYEPTVNPAPAGGYAWVVFTSRRLYGNESEIPPFCSDPRGVDLVKNITPKKLWVAAIDLSAKPGADASHPAFYLPAQELLAGNSRGFWVLDPCKSEGNECSAGDECCDGYCKPDPSGKLVCSNKPPMSSCSAIGDKCETAADCCATTNVCIGGFCREKGPA